MKWLRLLTFLLIRAVIVTTAIQSLSTRVMAEEVRCDPILRQTPNDPYGYRLRGDRCEGIYIKEVAGGQTLLLASFTESFEDFDASSGKGLEVEWPKLGPELIHLQVKSLKTRLYYRMDTIRSAASTPYIWPVDLLAALKIRKRDVGMVSWIERLIGGAPHKVYLPLRIKQQTTRDPPRGVYELTVLPGEQLSEVFITLAFIGEGSGVTNFLRQNEPMRNSYYPAERPVTLVLDELQVPGLYYVEVGAVLKRGGVASERFWIYHSGL